MIVKSLKLFSAAIASWWGLFAMNLLVFGVCARFIVRVIMDAGGRLPMTSDFTESMMESVALRLITVGVVMLERHEIVEMLGKMASLGHGHSSVKAAPADGDHDALADLSQPFGMFYLCGGLIMECFVDVLKHPLYFLDGPLGKSILLIVVMLFTLFSLLASVRYAYDLVVWRKASRAK